MPYMMTVSSRHPMSFPFPELIDKATEPVRNRTKESDDDHDHNDDRDPERTDDEPHPGGHGRDLHHPIRSGVRPCMTKKTPIAMAFFDEDAAKGWKRAAKYAGSKGRVATLPDVIAARIADADNWEKSEVWNSYITTTSAEYVGFSSGGRAIIIVAHGVGPIHDPKTLDASFEAHRKTRNEEKWTRGGRISHEEFLRLESGFYGPVGIVDLEDYVDAREYPFIESLSVEEAAIDPLLKARFGPHWGEYLQAHAKCARQYRDSIEATTIGNIVSISCPNNCHYGFSARTHPQDTIGASLKHHPGCAQPNPTMALAHLLVADQVMHWHIQEDRKPVLMSQFGCHESSYGSRFLGIPDGCSLKDTRNPNARRILYKHWADLLVPAKGKAGPIRHVVEFGKSQKGNPQRFTTTLRKGDGMDTGVYEHPVRAMKRLKGPELFTTKIGGYYGFFKYGLDEVAAIAPKGANTFMMGEPSIVSSSGGDPTHHMCPIEFFDADIDLKQRLMTEDELESQPELFVQLGSE